MALRLIVKEGEPLLEKPSRPVEKFDEKLWQLLDDMSETMYAAQGVGLAAPQVGVLRRICVIDVGDGLMELINPVITKTAGQQESAEGCLSSPGKYGITHRPKKVTVEYFDRHGNKKTAKGEDLLAKAFCHEIDHLDGILFKTHVIRWEK
ncbi:MAG: peptide deformylase [Clostridia bacterium]|nr:peptide deformylase [Clostridia bacterium]